MFAIFMAVAKKSSRTAPRASSHDLKSLRTAVTNPYPELRQGSKVQEDLILTRPNSRGEAAAPALAPAPAPPPAPGATLKK